LRHCAHFCVRNPAMPRPRLDPEIAEAIKGAPYSEPSESVARRLGVSERTVQNYRREARGERQEAARGVIAQHVQETVPDALGDLNRLRRLAAQQYEKFCDAKDGALWLNAIKTTLEHVSPDDSAIDAGIEQELARLAGAGQAADAGAIAGAVARAGNGRG